MGEYLRIEEIEARFIDEWVLLADPEPADDADVLAGVVIAHGSDRDEVERVLDRIKLREAALFFVPGPRHRETAPHFLL